MNHVDRVDLMRWSDEELTHILTPFDDQMNMEGVPTSLRAMKGWHKFVTEYRLDISLHDPASDRIVRWFRLRAEPPELRGHSSHL